MADVLMCVHCADSLGAFDFKRQNDQCMTSMYRESDPMLSNGSRGTLMSNTDHSVQRRLKSNAPID